MGAVNLASPDPFSGGISLETSERKKEKEKRVQRRSRRANGRSRKGS
jgi:hypothetical protein